MATEIAQLVVRMDLDNASFKSKAAQSSIIAEREARNTTREFRQMSVESRAAVDLLGDATGIRLPRELKKLIAQSQLIGPAFATAFKAGVVLAIAAEVINLLPKIKNLAEEIAGFGEAAKQVLKDVSEQNKTLQQGIEQQLKSAQALKLIGLEGSSRTLQEEANARENIANATDKQARANQAVLDVQKQIDKLKTDRAITPFAGLIGDLGQDTLGKDTESKLQKELGEKSKAFAEAANALKAAKSELSSSSKQFDVDVTKEAEQSAKKFEAYQKRISDAIAKFDDDLAKGATGLAQDPITKIALERLEALRQVEKDRTAAAAKGADEREVIEGQVAKRILQINQKAAEDSAAAYKEAFASVAQTTADLAKDRAFPQFTFPAPQLPKLNVEFLDVTRETMKQLVKVTQDQIVDVSQLRDVTRGYLESVMTDSQRYALTLKIINEAYQKNIISVDQLHSLTKRLNPEFERWHQAALQAGDALFNGIENAIFSGNSFREVLQGILADIGKIILRATLLKAINFGINALFGSIGGGIGGGVGGVASAGSSSFPGAALGGPVSAGVTYMVGETGPERFVPDVAGRIIPAGEGGAVVNQYFQIDARGADAGVEQKIVRAMQITHEESVKNAQTVAREARLRRP